MKKVYLAIFLVSSFNDAYPQIRVIDGSMSRYSVPIVNNTKDESIEGSPLLFEDWKYGRVILNNGEQYNDVRLNFDAVRNKFYYNQHDTSFELLSVVKEIRVKDVLHFADTTYDRVFKNNIHDDDAVKPETFAEVLSQGKIVLFRQYLKRAEGENSSNGIVKNVRKYVLHTYMFAIVNNQVIPVKFNSRSLEDLTTDKQDQVQQFVKSKQLSLKKEADFKQALSYYNSL